MSLTMATSEIADLDLDKSLDFSDIEDKMDELKDGTNQIRLIRVQRILLNIHLIYI